MPERPPTAPTFVNPGFKPREPSSAGGVGVGADGGRVRTGDDSNCADDDQVRADEDQIRADDVPVGT